MIQFANSITSQKAVCVLTRVASKRRCHQANGNINYIGVLPAERYSPRAAFYFECTLKRLHIVVFNRMFLSNWTVNYCRYCDFGGAQLLNEQAVTGDRSLDSDKCRNKFTAHCRKSADALHASVRCNKRNVVKCCLNASLPTAV